MKKKNSGQAVVEYILVFAFISLIGINMVRAVGGFVGNSMGSLGFHLTQQLSVGVCSRFCFGDAYENRGGR